MDKVSRNNELTSVGRITRDISDGLMLIDGKGTLQYINPSAIRILGNSSLKEGFKLAEYMASDNGAANDEFYQYILDSVYDKNTNHTGTSTYTRPDGSVRYFSIDTSYVKSDDGLQDKGVILSFSDITELQISKIKHDDTIKIMVALTAVLAIWNYVYILWKMAGEPISSTALTLIIEGVGIVGTIFALRFTSITWEDFGLGTKNLKSAVKTDVILTLVVLIAAIILKIILLNFFPGVLSSDKPFFYWQAIKAIDLLYIPTVVLQEFLTRGVIQGGLERMLPENYPPAISIVVSSLFFGAIHLHKGLSYMLGAAFLLSFFGILYRKQRTIWGLCIPHLLLSWSLRIILV